MDVGEWLRSLGLEQYAPAFEQNHINPELLPSLTADDLKELGVASVGHRRAILAAIADLRTGPTAVAEVSAPAPAAGSAAERRQLTVMFCDLVGSTALSARLDPEELREVIGAYHRCVAEAVRRFDGFVAKYMGDGVLVYFGYPRAHEDDAERAVRAGLAVVEAVQGIAAAAPLEVRIGIATGLVVVGDLIGEGASLEQAVVGETPNLAARLQAFAEPGAVVIAPATRRLIGDRFRLQKLGRHEVKGLSEPVEAWAVEGVSAVESRFEAVRGGRLTGFVGREHELGLLMERWNLAQDGEGQVVLLSGEPGIGKSRILSELRGRLEAGHATSLRLQCSPYYVNSAFYPIIDNFERAKSILESGDLIEAADTWEYAGRAGSLAIPLTLRDSLMARLDRFAPVKEFAQIGVAIGREFSWELIAAVAPHARPELDKALAQLATSGLAFQQGTPPDAVYTFKHALVQDAAYDSLLKARRQQLHGKIAKVIEEHFPNVEATEPELLAHHYTEAKQPAKAIPLWQKAGGLARISHRGWLPRREGSARHAERLKKRRLWVGSVDFNFYECFWGQWSQG
jgi:class 3 adenylate cyclase